MDALAGMKYEAEGDKDKGQQHQFLQYTPLMKRKISGKVIKVNIFSATAHGHSLH